MNCDLNVKGAFDQLFKMVSKLSRWSETGRLSAEDAKAALEAFQRVDCVLKVLF